MCDCTEKRGNRLYPSHLQPKSSGQTGSWFTYQTIITKSLYIVLMFSTLLHPAFSRPATSKNDEKCREPTEDSLHRQWVELNSRTDLDYLSETEAIVPIHTRNIIGPVSNLIPGEQKSHLPEVDFLGNIPCNEETNSFRFRSQLGTNERSLCRWYYVIQNDPHRYPRDITQARRKCEADDASKDCQAVVFFSRVLQRTKCDRDTGIYKYEAKWQEIILGFTSVRV